MKKKSLKKNKHYRFFYNIEAPEVKLSGAFFMVFFIEILKTVKINSDLLMLIQQLINFPSGLYRNLIRLITQFLYLSDRLEKRFAFKWVE